MKEYARYAIGILFLIGAIVLIVVGFNIIRSLFDTDEPEQRAEVRRTIDLGEIGASGMPVRYTISGTTVGNEQHREIRISVDRNSRRVEVLQGYNGQVLKSNQFDNNQQGYDAFISGLRGAGFALEAKGDNRGDEAQSCPLGRKYAYEIAPGTNDAFRTWSNSCGSRRLGTFGGNPTLVQRLFQLQIPDYNRYVSDVKLNY